MPQSNSLRVHNAWVIRVPDLQLVEAQARDSGGFLSLYIYQCLTWFANVHLLPLHVIVRSLSIV